jgi:hypothetical protein
MLMIFPPPGARDHMPSHCLRTEKNSFQIRIQHRIPVRLGDVDRPLADVHPGIVHEDVDVVPFFQDLPDHSLDRFYPGHVQRQNHPALPQRPHLSGGFLRSGLLAGQFGHHHIRTRMRQGDGNGSAHPAARPGYNCISAINAKCWYVHFLLRPDATFSRT